MRTAVRAQWAGSHRLPPLTDEEKEAFEAKRYHLVRKSAHVQAMEDLINESHSVPPDEVNGAVLYYEPEEQEASYPGYALLVEDEDGDLLVKQISFVGSALANPYDLIGLTKDELVKKRFEHVPPRALL